MSFAGFAMLLVTMGLTSWLWQQWSHRRINFYQLGALGLLVIVVIDFQPSLGLVHGGGPPEDLVRLARRLRELPGWRVATVDLSLLGSVASFLFSYPGGREQVSGWAHQGGVTAPLLAHINEAIVSGYRPYALDRLSLLGADDVVVLRQPPVPGDFPRAMEEAGFRL